MIVVMAILLQAVFNGLRRANSLKYSEGIYFFICQQNIQYATQRFNKAFWYVLFLGNKKY